MNAETTALKYAFQRLGNSLTVTVLGTTYTFLYEPSPKGNPAGAYITAEASVENTEHQHDSGLMSDVELVISVYRRTAGTSGTKRVVQQVADETRKLIDVNNYIQEIDGNQIVGIIFRNTATFRETIGPYTFSIARSFFTIKVYQNGN